jgi:hypothetical protein
VLLVLLVAALVWTFVVEPRRLKVTSVLVPEPAASRRPAGVPGAGSSAPIAPNTRVELLRSLERMEADLAELRAEVDRMRSQLRERQSEAARRGS